MSVDFSETLARYQTYPKQFFEEVLGVDTLEPYQDKVLSAIAKYSQVCIRATHSISKTYTLGRVVLWFFSCFHESIIITTAPTDRQVKKLLWGEIRNAHKTSKYPIGGRLLDKELVLGDKWYAIGFSTKDTGGTDKEQKGSAFQGFHSKHVLIVFDEATGITPDVFKMAEGLLTSGYVVKWVCIGNPTTRNCKFFSLFGDPSWHEIHLSCFDSPNMIANGLTNKQKLEEEIERLLTMTDADALEEIESYKKPTPHLLTAQWVVSRVKKWGMEHPLSLSKAFGEFPIDDDDVIVKYSAVQKALQREYDIQQSDERCIGVDVARFGKDKSVITDLVGCKQVGVSRCSKRKTTEVSGRVVSTINDSEYKDRPTKVLVDCTGIGAGVHDELIEAQDEGVIPKHVEIVEVHFGQGFTPLDTDGRQVKEKKKEDARLYVNVKAKMFKELGEDIESELDLLNESTYTEELPTIMYTYDSKGRVKIESKEEYKKRTSRQSPDDSDSLALANYGRHMDITHGTFGQVSSSKPLTKTKNRRDTVKTIGARIKATEY